MDEKMRPHPPIEFLKYLDNWGQNATGMSDPFLSDKFPPEEYIDKKWWDYVYFPFIDLYQTEVLWFLKRLLSRMPVQFEHEMKFYSKMAFKVSAIPPEDLEDEFKEFFGIE